MNEDLPWLSTHSHFASDQGSLGAVKGTLAITTHEHSAPGKSTPSPKLADNPKMMLFFPSRTASR